jgi:hypothetical protein
MKNLATLISTQEDKQQIQQALHTIMVTLAEAKLVNWFYF